MRERALCLVSPRQLAHLNPPPNNHMTSCDFVHWTLLPNKTILNNHFSHNLQRSISTRDSATEMPFNFDENSAPLSDIRCSQSKCITRLPMGYKHKNCEKCRNVSRLSMQKKRKREKDDEGLQRRIVLQPTTAPDNNNSRENNHPVAEYIIIDSDEELTPNRNVVGNLY